MRSLIRSLQDHSSAMLRAIADCYQVKLVSNVTGQATEQLAAVIQGKATDPEALLADLSPQARQALEHLLHGQGRQQVAAFERRFGTIRRFGPGRLDRERPQRNAANASEELWYRGLIFRAFDETPKGLVEFLYMPDDLVSLLPAPGPSPIEFRVEATAPPPSIEASDGRLAQDACTLLGLAQSGRVRLVTAESALHWRPASLEALNQMLLRPAVDPANLQEAENGEPPSLLLALAHQLGWFRAASFRLSLSGQAVLAWLDADPGRQQGALLDAWRYAGHWNDLCRTPALRCEDTGSWSNDPVTARERLLGLLSGLDSGCWYRLADFVAAVKQVDPDFQRIDGNYDTWYVRRRDERTYLRGFEHWDQVEGQVIVFILTGPLHWLGAVDLGHDQEPWPSPAAATSFRITDVGMAWLVGDASIPSPAGAGAITVLPDFTVLVPPDVPPRERFRVTRFTTWEASTPIFRYRITQTGLRRAAGQGIDARRVLDFLQAQVTTPLPENVATALTRWHNRTANAAETSS